MPGPQPDQRAPDQRAPGQRAGLSRDLVIGEARRLVRDAGLESMTMRALADRLGVAPNTLYSYVPDKAALLDALLDALLAEIDTGDLGGGGWREELVELMRRSRRVLLDQADLLPHLLARPIRGPNAIRLGEATLVLLDRAGLDGDRAVAALRILLVYTFGDVALEAPRRRETEPERRRAESVATFAAYVAARPHVARLAESLADPSRDGAFETGLRWLVDGIAADGQALPA